jgi:octaprenyl-diphosphate synthase
MNFSSEIIADELRIFETRFKDSVKSTVPLIDRIMRYIVKTKGKQMRPMFVLLSAKLSGTINESTYRAASLVELLHTASVYALWKAKASVLVGDYLLAKGMLLSLDNDDFRILQIMSRAVKEMSEGELLQMEKARSLNLDEELYYRIIRHKTASLLASACAAGAYSTSQSEETTEKMRKFGELVGVAFQIKDDLFDYGHEDVGKPTGNDIREKKVTLPLIYTINHSVPALRQELIYILKNQNKKQKKIDYVIDVVEKSGGIAYAIQKMNSFRDEALQILDDFQDSPAKQALAQLVNFTTDRKK